MTDVGLRYTQPYVVARDPDAKTLMLGGLGGMGVGRMWFPEEERHKDYPGYAEALIRPNGSVVRE